MKKKCRECKGTGKVTKTDLPEGVLGSPYDYREEECPKCKGTGKRGKIKKEGNG